MKYRFLFFDLDGTLLNTLDDLHNAVNTILTWHYMPEITPEQTAAFLGNGAGHLIHCAVLFLPEPLRGRKKKYSLNTAGIIRNTVRCVRRHIPAFRKC